jgi:DNA-binding GntR family transcriptional regulator
MESVFRPIGTRSMPDEIVIHIRNAIISGELDFGEHLTEQEIAEQMRVSRIPIREALRQLEQEGLVVRIPNRGCFVVDFTEQDVTEVFTLRATLEIMAVEMATPHLTPDDIAALQDIIDAQRQAIAAEDYERLTQLDLTFHEYICAKASHNQLLKAWRSQYVQTQILMNRRFNVLSDYTPQTVISDHMHLLEALTRRDAQAAAELTRAICNRIVPEYRRLVKHKKPSMAEGISNTR